MSGAGRRWLGVALPLALACAAEPEDAPAVVHGKLGPDACASVGADRIATDTVVRIARAQNVSPDRARTLAVRDALFAADAERRLIGAGAMRSAVLARAVLQELQRDAQASGPPSDDEVARLTAERWAEVDRPASARTTHAVVRTKQDADDARAREAAERVRRAVDGISEPERFIEAAKAVDTGGLELRAERLPAMTADGRGVPGPDGAGGSFDAVFARAANALDRPGALSSVIRSPFGYHVILLEEKLPERRVPLEERRRMFAPEIQVRRARQLERALLDRLRAAQPVEVSRAAGELLAQVRVAE